MSVHELSIARNIVEIVSQVAMEEKSPRVSVIHLQIGALSCVVPSALEFAFEVASQGTPTEGARLQMECMPVVVHCDSCETEVALESPQSFRCPRCAQPTPTLVSGRELEISRVELEEEPICAHG
jgi:hydrogenase nickel incorporation protein HypA/HybF